MINPKRNIVVFSW